MWQARQLGAPSNKCITPCQQSSLSLNPRGAHEFWGNLSPALKRSVLNACAGGGQGTAGKGVQCFPRSRLMALWTPQPRTETYCPCAPCFKCTPWTGAWNGTKVTPDEKQQLAGQDTHQVRRLGSEEKAGSMCSRRGEAWTCVGKRAFQGAQSCRDCTTGNRRALR